MIASPARASSSEIVSGGTTWIRLKLAKGSSPRRVHDARMAIISGLSWPYGANGSRVSRWRTSSIAQKASVPRTGAAAKLEMNAAEVDQDAWALITCLIRV